MEGDSTVLKIEEYVLEYVRQRAAENPLDAEMFLDQFPEMTASLRVKILSHIALLSTEGSLSEEALLLEDTDQSVLESTKTLPPGDVPAQSSYEEAPPDLKIGEIGDYELLEVIGRGGMGLVYKAKQLSLNRLVALKVIRAKGDNNTGVKRLRQEAHSAGKLHHPNIVPIYAFGDVDGKHFFTMQYVEGPSLAQLIKDGPLSPIIAAQYLRTIARTVAYSHEQEVVHRDLKPSNVLIDQWGQPCITDFGVARPITEIDEEQQEGYITGTPNYMAPEQSRSSDKRVLPASDIYSLGAVLYALLTGRPPFKAMNTAETLLMVRNQPPTPPSVLKNDIPADLETICLKCLEKEPHERYLTANSLADDLNHFLLGEPIKARPAGRIERFWRLCQRNRLISFTTALSLFLILSLLASLLRSNLQLKEEKIISHTVQIIAEEALYISDIRDAGTAWQEEDIQQLHHFLSRQIPKPGESDLRGGEWYFLWSHANVPHRVIDSEQSPIYIAVYSPNEKLLATAGKDSIIRFYDSKTYHFLYAIKTNQTEINGLHFSPDNQKIASVGDDGTLKIWYLGSNHPPQAPLFQDKIYEKHAYNVLYNQEGTKLYTAGDDPILRIRDAYTGDSAGELIGHTAKAGAIALSPDGQFLASAGNDSQVIVWDLKTLSPKWTRNTKKGRLTAISWSHDGTRLAATSIADQSVLIYNSQTGERLKSIEYMNELRRAIFSQEDDHLIVSDSHGMIHITPISEERAQEPRWKSNYLKFWRAHQHRIYALTLSPTKNELITGGSDDHLFAWKYYQKRPHWFLQKENPEFDDFVLLQVEGREVLISQENNQLEIWDPSEGTFVSKLPFPELHENEYIDSIAASNTRPFLAVGTSIENENKENIPGNIYILNAETGKMIFHHELETGFAAEQVLFSPDNSLLGVVNHYGIHENGLLVFDLKTGKIIPELQTPKCHSIAFSTDNTKLFSADDANRIDIWDLAQRKKISQTLYKHFSTITHLQSGPNNRILASCSNDRSLITWNLENLKGQSSPSPLHFNTLAQHRNVVLNSAFNQKGDLLASCGDDGKVILWNISTSQKLFELNYEQAQPTKACFSHNDRFLVCHVQDKSGDETRGRIQIMRWDPRN